MKTKINWHRVFGLMLIDFFTDSNYCVELEKDLSIKKQYLDVVIIKKLDGAKIEKLPDGFDNMVQHNLLTYKSIQEPLDRWALEELIGHYVNYRKQVSPSMDNLLPDWDFQLYAVTTRYPHNLTHQISIEKIQTGVYDIQFGFCPIRLIVLSRIPKSAKNALWHLLSGKADNFAYGDKYYHWHCPDEKAVLNQLYELYQVEGVVMPYTMEDFRKDFTREHLHLLSPAVRLNGIPPAERLNGIPLDERLKGVSPKIIEEYLSKLKHK